MIKGVFVILDGMGDLPNQQLGGMTPLEAAETPNMDFFASRGKMGLLHPVRPGFVPESDEAIVSIFGNKLISSTRGQLEVRGSGIKLTRGDLALRVNFATIDSLEKGNVLDRRAGRTLSNSEAHELARALEKMEISTGFVFVPSVQHRAALVFRGGFSDNITGNDSTYYQGKANPVSKIERCKPMDADDDNAVYTCNVVNEFVEKAFDILDKHPVNIRRKERGLMPANYLLVRGAGIEKPYLKQYKKWLSVAYMPLERGFSETSGMQVYGFDYPVLKGVDSYANLWKGLMKACKYSIKGVKKFKKKVDYVYLHIKETDLPGHDNKPLEKKHMIEYVDKTLFKFLRKFCPPNDIKVVVTADHSTPCKLKDHSADPVPVLFYDCSKLEEAHFSEKEAKLGELGTMKAGELLKKVGFVKKK